MQNSQKTGIHGVNAMFVLELRQQLPPVYIGCGSKPGYLG